LTSLKRFVTEDWSREQEKMQMNLSLTIGPLTPDEIGKAVSVLTSAGFLGVGMATTPAPAADPPKVNIIPPPQKPAPAMPPMPGNGSGPKPEALPAKTEAPPPPPAPAPAAPSNAKLEQVLKLMDSYSRAGHQVAGARKVLALLGLSRVQDASEEQLDWLAQAFANTGWAP
jgi:hypothetical protein